MRRVILAAARAACDLGGAHDRGCAADGSSRCCGACCVGTGTGVTSMVLAAIVATRWFDARRGAGDGRAVGRERHRAADFPAAARAAGRARGWRTAALIVAGAGRPRLRHRAGLHARSAADLGLRATARRRRRRSATRRRPLAPLAALRLALRSRAFWVLAGTFFICGASTNGLIGTHLIAACHDYGIPQVRSAQLLAVMGIFDILGTTASGWLTDRYSSRHLLFAYYTLRGLSLLYPAVHARTRARTASAGSRSSTVSTGSPPCRRPCG